MNKFWTLFILIVAASIKMVHADIYPSPLLAQAHEDIKPNKYTGIDSMLVYRNGKLLSEQYYGRFNADTLHRTHSTFKSITGLITLIALDQELLTLDEPVLPLLATFRDIDEPDPRKNKITFHHLLNMTSGLSCDESPSSDGPNHEYGIDEGNTPLNYALAIEMASPPGETFRYCNANSFLLAASISAALKRAGRENIFQFAEKYLLQPLGIRHYRFTKSFNGEFLNGQGNAYFLPADLAKLGLVVLNQGNWQDKQIISRQAINQLFTPSSQINWSFIDLVEGLSQTKSTYSAQWYTTTFDIDNQSIEVIHSWGNGGQFIFVIPSLESVVVFTGSNQGNFSKQKQPFDVLHKYVLPALMVPKAS